MTFVEPWPLTSRSNNLTFRSKAKVQQRSLWYVTHRLMVMHPHTKYHWPISKDKNVIARTRKYYLKNKNLNNYVSPSNDGRHVVLVWFFLPLPITSKILWSFSEQSINQYLIHLLQPYGKYTLLNSVLNILPWNPHVVLVWFFLPLPLLLLPLSEACLDHNFFVFPDRSIICGMWVHDHKAVCCVQQ
jgi:hypothetical protein